MKKIIILIMIIISLLIVGMIININSEQNDEYLNKEILNGIMYDYNYLTGNSDEVTLQYFEELKTNSKYSSEFMKKSVLYGNEPYEIILKIQAKYSEITAEITDFEKKELDKYLLENSLMYYYQNSEK